MLKYQIPISFLFSICLAVMAVFLVGAHTLLFYIYDAMALSIGIALVYFSNPLLKMHRYSALLGLFAGFTMIVFHTIKLVVGKCV